MIARHCRFPFPRNCRIVHKVQRVRRTSRIDTPVVKLKSLLSPTNLAGGWTYGPSSTKKKSANVSERVGALNSHSATPFGCRYGRTIITIVTHGFPYSSGDSRVRGPARAAVKLKYPAEYRGGEGNAERSIDRPYVRQLLLSSCDDLPCRL